MKRPNLALNLVFLFLFLFAFWRLWFSGMLAYGDTMPSPENISQAFKTFFSSWQPLSRGLFYPQTMITFWQGVVLIPFFKFPSFAQHIFNFSPFFLSFIFANLFLVKIIDNKLSRFLASFFYAVNPVTIGTFIGGATGMLYVYAFFPVLVSSFWQIYDLIINKENLKKILYQILIFVLLFTFSYSIGAYTIFLFFPVVIFFLIKALLSKAIKQFFTVGFLYVGAVIFCLLLTLPFSFYGLPLFSSLFGGGGSGLDVQSLMQDLKISYGSDPFINIGLGGTYASENLKYLNWAFPFGYVIAILFYLSPFFGKGEKQKKLATFFCLFSLLILGFIYLTHIGKTFNLFLKVPLLLTFRSPAKLIMLLSFIYLITFAISLEGILFYEKKLLGRLLASVAILLVICVYSWPFFTGDLTLKNSKKDLGSYIIPKHYYEISKDLIELHKKEGYFRTIWLPFSYAGTELKIHWLDENAFYLPLGWSQHGQSNISQYTIGSAAAIGRCDKNLGQFWAPASIKYIILDLKQSYSKLEYFDQYVVGPPEQLKKCLDSQSDLQEAVKNENYIIYQNKAFQPKITAYLNKPTEDWLPNQPIATQAADVKINIKKENSFSYILEAENTQPFYLVLAEPFHANWQGQIDGKKIEHFSAYWLNGYYIDKVGKNKIEIIWIGQKIKTIIDIVFIIVWLTWLLLFIKLKIMQKK